mmetsp:Transcript_2329/g.4914  ORF Transcript_2329/g.4914 Transcript_2329/m.4914 type:complete len:345 (+) Transcript_2329:2083-3117(+)
MQAPGCKASSVALSFAFRRDSKRRRLRARPTTRRPALCSPSSLYLPACVMVLLLDAEVEASGDGIEGNEGAPPGRDGKDESGRCPILSVWASSPSSSSVEVRRSVRPALSPFRGRDAVSWRWKTGTLRAEEEPSLPAIRTLLSGEIKRTSLNSAAPSSFPPAPSLPSGASEGSGSSHLTFLSKERLCQNGFVSSKGSALRPLRLFNSSIFSSNFPVSSSKIEGDWADKSSNCKGGPLAMNNQCLRGRETVGRVRILLIRMRLLFRTCIRALARLRCCCRSCKGDEDISGDGDEETAPSPSIAAGISTKSERLLRIFRMFPLRIAASFWGETFLKASLRKAYWTP